MFSILPNTDGFFGSIFYILGRFSKLPPPSPSKIFSKSSRKTKKRILSDESGQKFEKSAKMARFGRPKKAISLG